MNNTKRFDNLRLQDKYRKRVNSEEAFISRLVSAYFSNLNTTVFSIYFPGRYDLVSADNILHSFGFRRYSIDYIPPGEYRYVRTKVTLRNHPW